jgi:hypothetical protein
VVFVLTWPVVSLAPTTGLDPSWQAGLHLAAHERIGFGDDLAFTYGPLGFLNFPLLYYPFTAALAAIYVVGARLAISLSLVWAARRFMPLPLAFAFALLTAGVLTFTEDAIVVPVLIWCVAALLGPKDGPAARALPVAGGILAGVELLSKLNVGVTIFILLLVAVVALPNYRRALGLFAGSFVVTLLVAWFATGGSLTQLWPYLLNAGSIMSGYSSAMQYDDPDYQGWLPFAIAAVIGIGGAGAISSTQDTDRRTRIAVLLLWAIFSFVVFKEGFVRQGVDRKAIFFGLMLAGLFAFRWRSSMQVIGIVGLVITLLFYFGATHTRFSDVVQPRARADRAFDQLKTMVSPSRRNGVIEGTKANMRAAYALDPASLRLVGNAPVHIYPHEATAAWAYGLEWKPLPVFQTYTAYTTRLDVLNADALASDAGPEVILRQPEEAIDSRNGTFDSPAAVVAMVCNYDEVRATRAWQVLRRVPGRCGPERPIGEVDAAYGQVVSVPAGRRDELVLARVDGIRGTHRERIRTLIYRAHQRVVAINGIPFRFVPGTATDGLLLKIPERADWSGPFGFSRFNGSVAGGNAGTIAFYRISPAESQPEGTKLSISFYAMPIRPSQAGRRAR